MFRHLTVFLCVLFLIWNSAGAEVVIKSELTQEHTGGPGHNLRGSIVVRNQGKESEEVNIYQTDYLFYADGTNLYGDPGQTPRSNAAWVTFSPKRIAIPAGEEISVNYAVQIPNDSELKGTYWSLIMVEAIPRHLTRDEIPVNAMGINVVWRYGIQIVTHMADPGVTDLHFSSTRLVRDEGKRFLQVDLENTGERWMKPAVWAELFDEAGKSMGKFEGTRMRIYPGTSVRHRIDLSGVPAGTYRSLLIADGGRDDLFGANYTLKIEE
ncbi:MAG TPA: hypothetical protein ENN03_07520 [bacterium]|nr:hypothetical protein [bacterium]